jgi:hypothetical protein
MTKNVLDIQTISTKWTDFNADSVLICRHVTIEKENAAPSHFLKFLLASRTNGSFGFSHNTTRLLAKSKDPFFSQQLEEKFGGAPYIEEAVSQFLNDRVK